MNELLEHDKPIETYYSELAELQSEVAAEAGAVNHSIYEEKYAAGVPGYTDLPCCMYFYYVRINSDGRLFVSHYFYPGGDPADPANPADHGSWPPIPYDKEDPTALRDLIKELALNARPKGIGEVRDPLEMGSNFKKIGWNRKSYIAIFVDEVNWQLHKFDNKDPSVLFITEEKDGTKGLPNHSFFDALDLSITMPIKFPKPGGPTSDERSAIVFINHMKGDEQGNDIGRDVEQPFKFKMFFKVLFADNTEGMTVIFDPDGNNLGPPLPPP